MRRVSLYLWCGMVFVAALLVPSPHAATAAATAPGVRAVSIDPADYLSAVPDASALARQLTEELAANGVNRVYLNAYNVEYGAYYRTSYRYNEESEYGRQDLLGKLLAVADARGIEVVAAFYDHQHRGAWEARPEWREKTATGADYNPPITDIQYYLSPGHPQAVAWWRGFLLDVLRRYPALAGVEFREPIVNWWGTEADHNPATADAFRAAHRAAPVGGDVWRRFRQETLTRFLRAEIALVHASGRFAEVTTVADAGPSGSLMTAADLASETGFDLDGLLAGVERPDAVKVELIWQQWARVYGRIEFTPDWTRGAARAFLRQVRGRTDVIVHVELTDFGRSTISVEGFYRTLLAARIPGVSGLDFYSASLADRKAAWPAVRSVYGGEAAATAVPGVAQDRRVLVLLDAAEGAERDRRAATRIDRANLLNLLEHFDVTWETGTMEGYRRGDLAGHDAVVYLGSVYGNATQAFLSDVSVFDGAVVWIGANLWQLARSGVELPLTQPTQVALTDFRTVTYGDTTLPAKGEVIPTAAGEGAEVVATLAGPSGRVPYIVRIGNLWYVAGSPLSFVEMPPRLNGRYLVFADALHDMLGVAHAGSERRAFVRIEDVNPLTPPDSVREVAAALEERDVPFLIGVTPVFVDPERGSVALSERPELVAALREAVARGGAVVLHGSTHQYRGTTGVDAEFWDLRGVGGVAEDGEDFVRARLLRGIQELWRNDLHPLAWETPHYLASPFDYSLFAQFFSTFAERRTYGVLRGAAEQQILPFQIEADVYGGRILPENLGYVAEGTTDPDDLIANAAELRVVRDALAGGYVHVGLDPDVATGLADGLESLGYTFVDLYDVPNAVELPRRVELTAGGTASLPVPSGSYLRTIVLDRTGAEVRRSTEYYASYSRPTRSFTDVPAGGLVSLRVLGSDELGEALDVPGGGGVPGVGYVTALFYVAGAAVTSLVAAYVVAKARLRKAVRR